MNDWLQVGSDRRGPDIADLFSRHVREHGWNPAFRDLPIVVISTEGSKTRIERLERKGVRFIHKPFTPEVIKEIVSEIAGAHNERHA